MSSPHAILYWDSCVFIDLLERTPGRIEQLLPIIGLAERKEILIVTSALSLSEVSRLGRLRLDDESVEQMVSRFFENPYLSVRPADRFVAEMSRPLIRNLGLKPLDAIHVATALMMKVDMMQTYDAKILKLNGQIKGLPIEEPGCVK